jgi:hypothetical protein
MMMRILFSRRIMVFCLEAALIDKLYFLFQYLQLATLWFNMLSPLSYLYSMPLLFLDVAEDFLLFREELLHFFLAKGWLG